MLSLCLTRTIQETNTIAQGKNCNPPRSEQTIETGFKLYSDESRHELQSN